MAKVSEDPPSPVDNYVETPPPGGSAAVPPPVPPYVPPYGEQPAYPTYAYAQPGPRNNVLALVSLVASCVGIIFGLGAIAGVITGHIALSQIKRTGEGGRPMALAGVIIGYCLIGIGGLAVIGYIIFLVVIIGAASSTGFDSGQAS